jgi:small subunit ribosomal protein S17
MAEDETLSADDAAAEAATEAPDDAVAEPADETEAPAAPQAAPASREPAEVLTPKERRRRRRAAKAPAPRGPVSAAERQAERDAQRAAKAVARRSGRLRERSAKPATTAAATPEPSPQAAGRPKTRQGIVVSDKAEKTITVRVDTTRRHRRYKKIVRLSKTLHAHDERNEAHEGDLVRVIETRPLSATKRWRLAEILERAR